MVLTNLTNLINLTEKGEIEMSIDRTRQEGLVEGINEKTAVVVGCGAIGRQVALQLGAMGCGAIHLIDFDKVEERNICNQGWRVGDVGRYKVVQLAEQIREMSPETKVTGEKAKVEDSWLFDENELNRYNGEIPPVGAVFACTDDMSSRKFVVERVKDLSDGYVPVIEGRMLRESFEIRIVDSFHGDERRKRWLDSWFSSEEAVGARACGSIGTIYVSNIIGGLMTGAYAKLLRGDESRPPYLIEMDIGASFWSAEWRGSELSVELGKGGE